MAFISPALKDSDAEEELQSRAKSPDVEAVVAAGGYLDRWLSRSSLIDNRLLNNDVSEVLAFRRVAIDRRSSS